MPAPRVLWSLRWLLTTVQSKLDTLFKKNLYDIAINLAKSQQADSVAADDNLVAIYSQYAGT